ncbi:MAG TPA: ABC transporter permease [Candidatus Binatia bacterium]|jgi:ABC-2 type transport system permease protein|nr:ABC transporter permease [Candidatus Binatia bacterium]
MARLGLNAIAAAAAASGASARRNRQRMFILFILPIVVLTVIGLAMGGYTNPSFVVGVLDRADTPESRTFIATIAAQAHLRIRRYVDQEQMRIAVFRGRLNGGIMIPPGWHGIDNLAVYLSQASVGSPIIRATIDAQLSRMARGAAPPDVMIRFLGGGSREGPPRLGFQYTAPANMVLFIMIHGFVASLSIIQLRRSGLSKRLLATPRHSWELFAMLAIGPLQVMIIQAAFLIVSTWLAFGVSWGDPLGVFLVTTALIGFGVSLVFCMGTVFRTPEQTASLGPWMGVVLGMLGGCMWPLEVVPPFMKTISHLSPAAWAMDAYLALIFDRVSARLVLPEVTVLLLFAAILTLVGLLRLRPQFSR